ncbi:MAG: HNH endonuclease, partial [Actinomycetota bacterium]|nr:HNH endonuclease [Actinomycetota bacterium]
ALRAAAAQSLWSLNDDEVAGRVAAAMALRAQADALLLAAVGEADARDLARRRGATSIRAWLRDAHRCDPREAARLTAIARGLRSGLSATQEAMTAGAVSLDQARVIVRYVGLLAKEVPAQLVARGETDMIGLCAQLDPVLLAVVGRRLAELVDPDGTQDRDEADALDREARATAARTASLTAFSDKPGGILRAVLDAEGYATLAAWLDAAAAPPPPDEDGVRDPRSPGQRRADALVAACEQGLAGGTLRARGGVKPRIIVTIPVTSLLGSTGFGLTHDGMQISPTLSRALGCDAEFLAAVLDPDGNLLNCGRLVRLFAGKTRLALELRDRGCAWPGCDRPISWTQAHHIVSWLEGGETKPSNGVLLCPFHHREIEKGDWEVAVRDHRAWFRPPKWIDHEQRWRINHLHHPPPQRQ